MADDTCSVPGCDRPVKVKSRRLCNMHYRRWQRNGSVERVLHASSTNEERFWAKVDRRGPDECWPWIGGKDRGYGAFKWAGKIRFAHRASYEINVGPIPDGLHIDHLCRNPACVNPAHLESRYRRA